MNSFTTSSKAHRRYLWQCLILSGLFCGALPLLLVYAVDPMQRLRKAWYQPVFSTNERYQNPGLALNYDYDTLVIGTSRTQNFMPSQIDAVLGGRALKLSVAGSTAHEQYLLLSLAISTGKPKRVIWGVDHGLFRGAPQRVRDDLAVFPYFMYEAGPIALLQYLYNWDQLKSSVAVLKDRNALRGIAPSRPDDDWDTFYKYYRFGRDRVLEDYVNPANMSATEQALKADMYNLEVSMKSFRANMKSLVQRNPAVQFEMFFPPYSILNSKFYIENYPEVFEHLMAIKAGISNELLSYPNVRIHDFEAAAEITHALDRYKDLGHYDEGVNALIIEAIASGRYQVDSSADMAGRIAALRRQAMEFSPLAAESTR